MGAIIALIGVVYTMGRKRNGSGFTMGLERDVREIKHKLSDVAEDVARIAKGQEDIRSRVTRLENISNGQFKQQ
uniref:Uncharacterized protein n=1 Tax=viral metagenome TaxID=1070528 RepID=A0A6M3JWU3_9ZZZZ